MTVVDTALFTSFMLISVGLILIPGPNVLVIVSTSLAHGRVRGLQTVAGTTFAMAIQIAIAAVGTAWFIRFVAEGFYILKWMGIAYLLYLGWSHLKRACYPSSAPLRLTVSGTFARGFLVSLTNPKTILFFTAFLPQFVSAEGNYAQQVSILSATFVILAALLDSCYAILAATLHPLLAQQNHLKIQHGIIGILYLGASAWLSTFRRAG
jgi:threonine/homoserine/homoserine lactone efflux protein